MDEFKQLLSILKKDKYGFKHGIEIACHYVYDNYGDLNTLHSEKVELLCHGIKAICTCHKGSFHFKIEGINSSKENVTQIPLSLDVREKI